MFQLSQSKKDDRCSINCDIMLYDLLFVCYFYIVIEGIFKKEKKMIFFDCCLKETRT